MRVLQKIDPAIFLAVPLGLLLAFIVLRPVWSVARQARLDVVAAAVAVVLLLPVVLQLVEQTSYLRKRGLTEVGSMAFEEPPLSEAAVGAARGALNAGESWTIVTPKGRCTDDNYAFYWLAFRLLPNMPDCNAPAVTVFWQVEPPAGVEVAARGDGFWISR